RPIDFARKNFSAGETAAIEKVLLFRRGDTAKHGIAMGKPAEPPDDVGMNFRPFQIFRVARRLVEGNAALLVYKILGVLEGKIKEVSKFCRHRTIECTYDVAGV